MNLTVQEIGRAVRTKIMDDGLRPVEAARAVAEQICSGQNGRLGEMYVTGFLGFACQHAEQVTRNSDPLVVLPVGDGANTFTTPTPIAPPFDRQPDGGSAGGVARGCAPPTNPPPPVRRTKYDAFWSDPLAIIIPVANTGTRKAIGDLDDPDLATMERYAASHEETWGHARKACRSMRRKLGKGETVRDVWVRLSEDERRFLTRGHGAEDGDG